MNKTWPEHGRDHSARKLWAGSGEITSSQAIRKILSSDSSTCRKGLHRNIRSVSHSLAAHASAPHRCESVSVQCLLEERCRTMPSELSRPCPPPGVAAQIPTSIAAESVDYTNLPTTSIVRAKSFGARCRSGTVVCEFAARAVILTV